MRRYRILAILLIITVLLNACAFNASPVDNLTPGASSAEPTPASTNTAGPPTPGTAERTTITFGAVEDERSVYAPLIATFEKDHPEIHVQFVALDSILKDVGFFRGMRQVMSAVDVAEMPASGEAIAKGWVRDLKPLMDADASFDRADFYPNALEAVSKDAGIYMLPRALHVPLIFYNKDLWAAEGLKAPAPDWKWTDVANAAEQLARQGGGTADRYGLLDEHAWVPLKGEFIAAGANIDSPDLRLDDPAVVAALGRVVALMKSRALYAPDFAANNANGGNFPDEVGLIRDQQIGMWSPDLCCYDPLTFSTSFAVGVVPFPAQLFPYFSSIDGYTMSSGTEHPEAAWRWITFLSHQDYPAGLKFGVDTAPARKSIAEGSGYWQKLDPENMAVLKAVLDSPASPRLVHFNSPGTLADVDFEPILHALVSGEGTAQAVLGEAQRARDQQLAQQPPQSPTSERIVVATPVPEASTGATAITFGVPGYAVDQTQRFVTTFNANNPDVAVTITNISTPDGMRPFASVAATTDCFTYLGLPSQTEITATIDLQPLIDADPNIAFDDYSPALLAPFQHGGGLYGLPYEVYFRALHYNQSAFDLAQLAYPTPAWTIDDFVHAAQQLSQDTGARKQYGFAPTGDQTREVFFFLDRFGASETTGSGDARQLHFTDPQVVAAIRSYVDLLRTTAPHARLQGYRQGDVGEDADTLITAGQVGMWLTFSTDFLSGGPGAQPGFVWAIAPPPLGKSAITNNDFVASGMYISAKTQQREACWTWIKALSHDVAGLAGGFPARRSLAESNAFIDHVPPGAAAVYQAYRDAMDRTSNAGSAADRHDQEAIDYYWFFQAIDHALAGKDLERELTAAQTLTEQYLACVRGGSSGGDCARRVDPDYQGQKGVAPGAQ